MEFGPIRAVKGDTILSPYLPQLGVRISGDYIYLGDLQYISQGIYHIEDFIYVCPNSQGHATRLLVVQFEGFLDHKEGTFTSPSGSKISLAEDTYDYTFSLVELPAYYKKSPGLHLAHAADYVRQRAYTLAGDMIYYSFVRLVTEDHRNRFSIHHLNLTDDPHVTSERLLEDQEQQKANLAQALGDFAILK